MKIKTVRVAQDANTQIRQDAEIALANIIQYLSNQNVDKAVVDNFYDELVGEISNIELEGREEEIASIYIANTVLADLVKNIKILDADKDRGASAEDIGYLIEQTYGAGIIDAINANPDKLTPAEMDENISIATGGLDFTQKFFNLIPHIRDSATTVAAYDFKSVFVAYATEVDLQDGDSEELKNIQSVYLAMLLKGHFNADDLNASFIKLKEVVSSNRANQSLEQIWSRYNDAEDKEIPLRDAMAAINEATTSLEKSVFGTETFKGEEISEPMTFSDEPMFFSDEPTVEEQSSALVPTPGNKQEEPAAQAPAQETPPPSMDPSPPKPTPPSMDPPPPSMDPPIPPDVKEEEKPEPLPGETQSQYNERAKRIEIADDAEEEAAMGVIYKTLKSLKMADMRIRAAWERYRSGGEFNDLKQEVEKYFYVELTNVGSGIKGKMNEGDQAAKAKDDLGSAANQNTQNMNEQDINADFSAFGYDTGYMDPNQTWTSVTLNRLPKTANSGLELRLRMEDPLPPVYRGLIPSQSSDSFSLIRK